MVTGIQEETSSGKQKQKKAGSTSQPKFRRKITPATIEADQILLALQKLATNSDSANFNNNNINRISNFPKSLRKTIPTFDRKSENFELFEDLFRTGLKIYNQLTEGDKTTNSLPSCLVMHYKPSKTSPAPTDIIWEKF